MGRQRMSGETIEIYVRNSGGRNLLHVHKSDDAETAAAKSGVDGSPSGFLELSVLSEWITDPDLRAAYEKAGEILHLRIPISGDLPF